MESIILNRDIYLFREYFADNYVIIILLDSTYQTEVDSLNECITWEAEVYLGKEEIGFGEYPDPNTALIGALEMIFAYESKKDG